MGTDIFSIDSNGARFTVFVAVDEKSSLYLGLAIFLGLVLALTVYAKILR